jgi:hypothetical protein
MGTIYVLSKNNEKKCIREVYYVQGLKHNLISVGQLSQHGYDVVFKGIVCTIHDKPPSNRVIAQIKMTSNCMYPIILKNAKTLESYSVMKPMSHHCGINDMVICLMIISVNCQRNLWSLVSLN